MLTLNSLKINSLNLVNTSCKLWQSSWQYFIDSSWKLQNLFLNSFLRFKYSLEVNPVQYSSLGNTPV